MTDKKTFGSFIKLKRIEKNYSQKDLAQMLYVTEGAVSKWERGVSYPDITLISDICRVLDISEHEFVTASSDTSTRKVKNEAKKFRIIRSAWILAPTISYSIAILTCFICNLAVNHTLSWFFIVLAALICAYTFVPTVSSFFKSKKLLVFAASTYLSICQLLFVCAVYSHNISWFLTACISILMGYVLVFLPIFLSKTSLWRYKFIITFSAIFMLIALMLMHIRIWQPFKLGSAILMTAYCFAPVIVCAVVCFFRFSGFIKGGICITVCAVVLYFTNCIADLLFGASGNNHYRVDFQNWAQCSSGNVHLIVLVSCLLISLVLFAIGIFLRTLKKRKS